MFELDGRISQSFLRDLELNNEKATFYSDLFPRLLKENYHEDLNIEDFISYQSVTEDYCGLTNLINNKCYNSCLKLCFEFLSSNSIKNISFSTTEAYSSDVNIITIEGLQYLSALIHSLIELRSYKKASKIISFLENFISLANFKSFYSEPLSPSSKSFANVLFYFLSSKGFLYFFEGLHNEALTQFSQLMLSCESLHSNFLYEEEICKENDLFKKYIRSGLYLSWCLFHVADYTLCDSLLEHLIKKGLTRDLHQSETEFLNKEKENLFSINTHAQLLSLRGRLNLFYGDLTAAETFFSEAGLLSTDQSTSEMCITNQFLLKIANDDFFGAEKCLRELLAFQTDFLKSSADPQEAACLFTRTIPTLSNLAVCDLYFENVEGSLRKIQKLLKKLEKRKIFTEKIILYNTSCLYELQSSKTAQKRKSLTDYLKKLSLKTLETEDFEVSGV